MLREVFPVGVLVQRCCKHLQAGSLPLIGSAIAGQQIRSGVRYNRVLIVPRLAWNPLPVVSSPVRFVLAVCVVGPLLFRFHLCWS